MAHKVQTVYLIKNEKGEYYTGDWRQEDQWDARAGRAKEYISEDEILDEIKRDRKDIDEEEGYNVFPESLYDIEIKIRIIDLDYT